MQCVIYSSGKISIAKVESIWCQFQVHVIVTAYNKLSWRQFRRWKPVINFYLFTADEKRERIMMQI
jgi:hypothetical protein